MSPFSRTKARLSLDVSFTISDSVCLSLNGGVLVKKMPSGGNHTGVGERFILQNENTSELMMQCCSVADLSSFCNSSLKQQDGEKYYYYKS